MMYVTPPLSPSLALGLRVLGFRGVFDRIMGEGGILGLAGDDKGGEGISIGSGSFHNACAALKSMPCFFWLASLFSESYSPRRCLVRSP